MALLEHNQRVYNEAVEYFKNGGKDLLIVQDTGTGKSFICAELLNTIFKGMSVLYVVPVFKIAENFKNSTGCSDNIEFVSYRFFKDDVDLDEVDVIVFDEAHHIGSDKCGDVIQNIIQNNKDKYIIGLTATPVREDKVDVSTFFSKTINGASVFECIENGLMPKFSYISCSDGIIKDISNYARSYGVNSITRDGITYNLKIDYSNSTDLLKGIVKDTNLDKWICFFGSVEELDENEKAMEGIFQGYTIIKVHSYLEAVDLEDLSKQSKIVILSVNMFLEGVHIKGVQGVLISRNVGSVLVFRQILGRVSSMGSSVSPVVVDCTNTLSRIVTKLVRSERESRTIQNERSEYTFKDIINTTLVDKKYINISNLLQNLYDIGKYKTICGYTFKSDEDLARQLGISSSYLSNLKRRDGLSYEEIIDKVRIKTICGFTFRTDYELDSLLGTYRGYVCSLRKRGLPYEEVIHKGLNYTPRKSKKSVTVCGYTFKSDRDLANQLGVSSTFVSSYRRKGLSYEEIINKILNYLNPREVCGYAFKSDKDLAKQLGVSSWYIQSGKQKGLSYEEIIYKANNDIPKIKTITVCGYTFKSGSDLAKQLGVSSGFVNCYKRKGLSYEEIINKANEYTSRIKTVCGYTFESNKDLSQQLNKNADYVRALREKGLSYEEIINMALSSVKKTNVNVCGYTFKSDRDLSLQLNKGETYVSKLRSKGLSYEEIINKAIGYTFKICGYTFKSDSDLSNQLGKNREYVHGLRKKGLSYEEIINQAIGHTFKICGYTFKSDRDLSLQLNKWDGYVSKLRRGGLSYEEIIERATKE